MGSKTLTLAFFENEAAADAAVAQIKQWDKASKDVKLGAIGVLVKDEKGKIKTHKLGSRKTGLGAAVVRAGRPALRRPDGFGRRSHWRPGRLSVP